MQETSDASPLLAALKSKQAPTSSSPEDLLAFILAHYTLVPKDDEEDDNEPTDVQTQESHAP